MLSASVSTASADSVHLLTIFIRDFMALKVKHRELFGFGFK